MIWRQQNESLKQERAFTLIPAFVCRESVESGSLQRVLPQWVGPPAESHLVYTERELMPNRVRLLVDFLTESARAEI